MNLGKQVYNIKLQTDSRLVPQKQFFFRFICYLIIFVWYLVISEFEPRCSIGNVISPSQVIGLAEVEPNLDLVTCN